MLFKDTLSVHIPTQRSATPPECYRCEDSHRCRECNGYGEFYSFHGILHDCRKCNGHGICLECTPIEDECTGGYRCLCQLQEPCTPAGVKA